MIEVLGGMGGVVVFYWWILLMVWRCGIDVVNIGWKYKKIIMFNFVKVFMING